MKQADIILDVCSWHKTTQKNVNVESDGYFFMSGATDIELVRDQMWAHVAFLTWAVFKILSRQEDVICFLVIKNQINA